MLLGLICDIKKIGTELVASCESKKSLKGIITNLVEKEMHHSERRSVGYGVQGGHRECCW